MNNRLSFFAESEQGLTLQQRIANHNATRKYLLLYCVLSFAAILYAPNNKAQQASNILFILVALAHTYKALRLQQEEKEEINNSRRLN
jgi:hypothetical protein